MPLWLILLGGGALLAYLVKQGQAQASSSFTIGQTAYTTASTSFTTTGGIVTLQPWTRVYVETSDSSGVTQVRTDSGNVGTVPTSSLTTWLPPNVTMQVN